ncbi:unnamed protein product, partial [Closterium sp. NIES-54]
MTECVYESRLETFVTDAAPAPVVRIPVMKEGRKALEQVNKEMGLFEGRKAVEQVNKEMGFFLRPFIYRSCTLSLPSYTSPTLNTPCMGMEQEGRKALEQVNKEMGLAFDEWDLDGVNKEMGLAFDEWDLDYYTRLFREDIGRDPTNVELFDIAQSNSEHSRHWFFKGDLTVDGQKVEHTLMDLVKDTLTANPNNSVIGFKDNSSAIRGRVVSAILPENPGQPSKLEPQDRDYDILFTAETHNFPCAMEGHAAPWEDTSFVYPPNLAPPLQILLDASDGASDYGNKFGEPLIQGYTRTFGMRLASGERREWLKPIMFSGGIGQIDHRHLAKEEPDVGMLVVKIDHRHLVKEEPDVGMLVAK